MINVKRLEPDEGSSARNAVRTVLLEEVSEAHLSRFLNSKENYLIVAEKHGEAAGILLAYKLTRIRDEGAKLFIYEIEVRESFRRQGIGTGLIEKIREIAKGQGVGTIFGLTNPAYGGAESFYENTGAEIQARNEILFTYKTG
ncbi:MAG: GNAT family N-acetyltransferase [Acidobacteria bacterium]|nr:MAG: GNAT family N-acetyltransferase [Acidobacteriota bacterium]REK01380.1 MAG: GNAT family N-acetyltransferase [Acidobacteriota bacterium]REK14336.1 MAG: GNAT family N-acetyltransferase [Acidobacteriota bacterium]REK45051.1 MAG: GNAT family N-acetyltransferase [Acidobacteriota bacterium]